MDKTLNNVLETIGNTPIIKINKIAEKEGLKCNLFAKCEYMNPGGSVKERIGFNMVTSALNDGTLKSGDYVVESTSGNTGIGVALACVHFDLKCVITIPDKMSKEKINLLKALGAEVHVCDTALPDSDPER